MSIWILILIALVAMSIVMTALWFVQRRTHNAGIVDVAWTFGTGLCAIWFAWGADGDEARRWLVAILAGLWSARLGFYLAKRMIGDHEDRRYQSMREKWGDNTQRNLLLLFQVQAFWAVLFALPMLVAASNAEPGLRWYDFLGVGIWLVAVIGEAVADRQLQRFRKDPATSGEVCTRGLWRYSRHPNYFFEWIHWWAYVAIGLAGQWGWLTIFGPIVMIIFLFFISGIPITERALVKSRGDKYRRYQKTTSPFIPLPPKESPA